MESERIHIRRKAANILSWILIVLAIVCAIGFLVCIAILGLRGINSALLGWLCGGSLLGAALLGCGGYLFVRRTDSLMKAELDALEREDGADSFYVGDGTLCTFGKEQICIHGAAPKSKKVRVPYAELRFFSVCVRHAPRERGDWVVVLELPAHYLTKGSKREDPPVLIQTDGKQRLYDCLEKYGLSLLGEPPAQREGTFTLLQKYRLPDRKKRLRSALFLALGAFAAVCGVGIAFWNVTIGAVVAVFGLYLSAYSAIGFVRAKEIFSVFREGIYYRSQAIAERAFLKWEEIGRLMPAASKGVPVLRAECAYGAYEFPRPEGAYEYIRERFPKKCGEQTEDGH